MFIRVSFVFAIFVLIEFCRSAEVASRLKRESPVYDTIVVGLGASGLTAYSKLARHGKRVLGLEAADRIGGRVNTVKFGEGIVELGAEWIHGRNNSRTYELALANNISVKTQEDYKKVYQSDGSLVNQDIIDEIIENCLKKDPADAVEAQPKGQFYTEQCRTYLSKHKPEVLKDESFYKGLLEFMDFYTSSSDASDNWLQVTSKSTYVDLDEYLSTSWHKYGYKTLFEIILNTYNNGPGLPKNAEVELKKEVTQIVWTREPNTDVVVKCKDGTEYKAKNIIVTVSLGVLKAKHETLFSPKLPEEKQEAIQKISMGLLDKVLLSFDKVWWPNDITWLSFIWKEEDKVKLQKEDEWMARSFGVSLTMSSDNVMVVWLTGESARYIENLPEDVVKTKVLELIRRFVGKDVPEPSGIIRTTWFNNPFTLGSYTFDNLETPQHPNIRYQLAEPILDSVQQPRVLFAGEATNKEHFGTVHGAVETGIREANRLLGDEKNSIF